MASRVQQQSGGNAPTSEKEVRPVSASSGTTGALGNTQVLSIIGKALTYLVLIAGLCIVMLPLVWMISASVKPKAEIFAYPPVWIPSDPLWANYPRGLETLQFGTALKNTLSIAIPSMLGQIISCSLVGFGLARFKFPGRDLIFIIVLATMMLPGEVTLIPTYILFSKLGMTDTFWPFWLPAWLATSGFNIFLFRQFFLSIAPDLEDAARIDGAGVMDIFLRIFLPLSKPAVATVGLFAFMFYWNDFFGPLIYLPSTANKTLQLMLMNFQQYFTTDWGPMLAAMTVISLPPLIIYFFAQKAFIQGVVFTGLKD